MKGYNWNFSHTHFLETTVTYLRGQWNRYSTNTLVYTSVRKGVPRYWICCMWHIQWDCRMCSTSHKVSATSIRLQKGRYIISVRTHLKSFQYRHFFRCSHSCRLHSALQDLAIVFTCDVAVTWKEVHVILLGNAELVMQSDHMQNALQTWHLMGLCCKHVK